MNMRMFFSLDILKMQCLLLFLEHPLCVCVYASCFPQLLSLIHHNLGSSESLNPCSWLQMRKGEKANLFCITSPKGGGGRAVRDSEMTVPAEPETQDLVSEGQRPSC